MRDHTARSEPDPLHVSVEEGVPVVLRRSEWVAGVGEDRVESGECTVVLWQRVGSRNTWVYVGARTTDEGRGGFEMSTESAQQLLWLLADRLGMENERRSPTT
ncbi:hypothetical protein GCM10022198_02690 [Klugiella xanthotipulae]